MNKILFTADTHFGHEEIRVHCNRPFASCKDMDDEIIRLWNQKVGRGDLVYHLGDFSWGSADKIIENRKRLNGQIILIRGNHDKGIQGRVKKQFAGIYDQKLLKIEDLRIFLNHYSMNVWEDSCLGSWHLFGHSHGRVNGIGKSFDVGVDANGFTPLTLEEVINKMKGR